MSGDVREADQPAKNTDRELFREDTGNPAGSYYENSVSVTAAGAIQMHVGGEVVGMTIAGWHRLALSALAGAVVSDDTLDLAEIENRASTGQPSVGYPISNADALALIAEVRSLRAAVAGVRAENERIDERVQMLVRENESLRATPLESHVAYAAEERDRLREERNSALAERDALRQVIDNVRALCDELHSKGEWLTRREVTALINQVAGHIAAVSAVRALLPTPEKGDQS